MSKKFKLVQDKEDDSAWASIRRHFGLISLVAGVLIVAAVVLVVANAIGQARQHAMEKERAGAAMTRAARPPTPTPTPRPPVHINAKDGSDLRAGPGKNYAVVGATQGGHPITLVAGDMSENWFELDDGTWIAADDILGKKPKLPFVLPD